MVPTSPGNYIINIFIYVVVNVFGNAVVDTFSNALLNVFNQAPVTGARVQGANTAHRP